jgi:BadF/BadG/BcrA/BcrD ATPase family
MNYVIGIDGGGTKTLVLLADMYGHVIARGVGGPSNYNAVGFQVACNSLETAINIARKDYLVKFRQYVLDWQEWHGVWENRFGALSPIRHIIHMIFCVRQFCA